MKLKNKKTGEIVDFRYLQSDYVAPLVLTTHENDKPKMYKYNSLAELNAEWEDAPEEPKEYWYIYADKPQRAERGDILEEDFRAIGNYFETKEEAELAVRKLKAWKRLKDKGFRFDCYMRRSDWAGLSEVKALENLIDITAYLPKDKIKEMEADLDLLFNGGEK